MGSLYVIATPIGNLSDISQRALDILKNVSVICCEDTRQTIKLLNHYGIKQKMTSYHKFNENTKKNEIIQKLLNGEDVALVSDAGTPCISDPGYILVKEAREKKIDVYAVPGASASISSLSISGLDTKYFAFLGFLSQDNKKRKEELEIIKENKINTFVIYESPKRIVKLVEELEKEFKNSSIFIASDLTKIHERSFYGNIEEVLEIIKNDPKIEKGEYVVILRKENENSEIKEEEISLEGRLVDIIIKREVTLKEAVNILAKENKNIKKNEIYDASLKLKNIFTKSV